MRKALLASGTLAVVAGLFTWHVSAQSTRYDLVLRGGRVVDGTGSPWYRADIAIRGDAIARIAPSITDEAARVIDLKGLVVAPGFIDIHTHARRGIFDVPTADNYVRQGVTTLIEGPDGGSAVPLGPFLAKVAASRITPNFASFIGQGSIRSSVIGEVDRAATPDEIEKMRGLVRQGMEEGAFGLSSGLFYVPGTFTPTAEVVELAKVAGRMGGIYISHMRDEASKVLDSVRETITIGEQGGLPTQVTHHKVVGKKYWGRSVDSLKLVDEARARGVDATIDQYPYTASATSIGSALLPAWALEGGRDAVLKRLKNSDTRAKIRFDTTAIIRDERGGGDPKNVVVSSCQFDPALAGKNLAQITQGRGLPVTLENAAETALWIVEQGGAQGIFHAISEDDLQRILVHPATMIASDGEIPIFNQNHPHPRSYGTFSRVLGVYVREKKLLSLETAVQKMSALPAQRLGLTDRGVIRQGLKADLAIFDPARVRDTATFEKPHAYAEGVTTVVVNGEIVFENGAMTAARPGRVLYGPSHRGTGTATQPPARPAASSQIGSSTEGAQKPAADPYANNAAPGATKFPLAAAAGADSNARGVAPAGAINQGPFNPATWKYGPAFNPPDGARIWNPAKLKLMQGGKVTGGTVFSATDPSTYCAMANAGYDFVWTEMQHGSRDWDQAARMWRTCPQARAVPGARVAYADEREIQHALDAGALVIVVPTVDTVAEAIEARNWTYFPPLGRRSAGGGQAFDAAMWGGVPGGYRNTANDNIVLILMIETLEGLQNAQEIAKVPGVSALFAASGDLGNFSGYRQGSPDYERAINIVHDAAIAAKVRLCGPLAWRDRPDFTCFQAGSETAAIARGVAAELGPLANTQGKPEVGPFAAPKP